MSDGAERPEVVDDPHFLALVDNLQVMTYVYLGKIADPGSGTSTRTLPAAKASIDTLRMLRRKTNGNLSDGEATLLDHVIFELQMNYVDEASQPEPALATDDAEHQQPPVPEPGQGQE